MARPARQAHRPSLRERLLWFAGLWVAGVLTVAAVAFIIKLMLGQ